MNDLDDAIVEDTCHCTVCQASFLLGSNDGYVILDPPGNQEEAYEHGCQQVKLCVACVERILAELDERDAAASGELPALTPAERAAMESADMTPVLGTMEERLRVAMAAAVRFMRERDALRAHIRSLIDFEHALTWGTFHKWMQDARELIDHGHSPTE